MLTYYIVHLYLRYILIQLNPSLLYKLNAQSTFIVFTLWTTHTYQTNTILTNNCDNMLIFLKTFRFSSQTLELY